MAKIRKSHINQITMLAIRPTRKSAKNITINDSKIPMFSSYTFPQKRQIRVAACFSDQSANQSLTSWSFMPKSILAFRTRTVV